LRSVLGSCFLVWNKKRVLVCQLPFALVAEYRSYKSEKTVSVPIFAAVGYADTETQW
jgi:hypothetical protein